MDFLAGQPAWMQPLSLSSSDFIVWHVGSINGRQPNLSFWPLHHQAPMHRTGNGDMMECDFQQSRAVSIQDMGGGARTGQTDASDKPRVQAILE